MNRAAGLTAFTLNGTAVAVGCDAGRRLSDALREELGLRGTKIGCDAGDCGACTVLLDGAAVCACLTPVARVAGRQVTTVEGLAQGDLQDAFLRHGAAQCGICTPGMLMAGTALLAEVPHPTRMQAEAALGGVLCRCTGYAKIIDAVCDVRPAATLLEPVAGQSVGQGIARLDGQAKIDGTESYGADHWPVGALVVRAIRSPHAAAGFVFGDLTGWAAACRVTVFTASDIPGLNRFGVIPAFADQPALAEGEARFRGEAVALVAGEAEGMAGLDLSDFPVTWDVLRPGPGCRHSRRRTGRACRTAPTTS